MVDCFDVFGNRSVDWCRWNDYLDTCGGFGYRAGVGQAVLSDQGQGGWTGMAAVGGIEFNTKTTGIVWWFLFSELKCRSTLKWIIYESCINKGSISGTSGGARIRPASRCHASFCQHSTMKVSGIINSIQHL